VFLAEQVKDGKPRTRLRTLGRSAAKTRGKKGEKKKKKKKKKREREREKKWKRRRARGLRRADVASRGSEQGGEKISHTFHVRTPLLSTTSLRKRILLLFVVCCFVCLLFVVCCLLFVVCCLFVVCLFVVCCCAEVWDRWIKQRTGEDASPLAEKLNDGLILCKLVNAIKPGIVKAGPAKARRKSFSNRGSQCMFHRCRSTRFVLFVFLGADFCLTVVLLIDGEHQSVHRGCSEAGSEGAGRVCDRRFVRGQEHDQGH
jgi:hypothetical protein